MINKNTLSMLVDAALAIEKLRVASEVRQSHLFLNGIKQLLAENKITDAEAKQLQEGWDEEKRLPPDLSIYLSDAETDGLHAELVKLEKTIDKRVAVNLKEHPAYGWFSRVKGVGDENIGKIVGPIDIRRADTISALWKFAGMAPEGGHAMKRVKGEKLHYNSQLRSMCWRLATSLRKAGIRTKCPHCGAITSATTCSKCGKSTAGGAVVAISHFATYYLAEKAKYEQRFARDGIKVLPTPPGGWMCSSCGKVWKKKVDIGTCCDSQQIIKAVKQEPAGIIWKGHLDNMALRKMIKLFLACLWLEWRQAEHLPIRDPYPVDKLGHTKVITSEEMADRPKDEEWYQAWRDRVGEPPTMSESEPH